MVSDRRLADLLRKHHKALPGRRPGNVASSDEIIGRAFHLSLARDPDEFTHSYNTASLIAEIGFSHHLVALSLLHHSEPSEYNTRAPDLSEDLDAVSRIVKHDMTPTCTTPEASHEAVMGVLKNRPHLIPLLLASAVDHLTALHEGRRVPAFELTLRPNNDEFAEDAFHYLSPLAHYFHLDSLTWRLEDAVLALTNPTLFAEIKHALTNPAEARRGIVDVLARRIRRRLVRDFGNQGAFRIQGRSKGVFSIARKVSRKPEGKLDLSRLGDLIALRVIIDDPKNLHGVKGAATLGLSAISEDEKSFRACLQVVESIAAEFGLSVARADDYFHYPTASGYQALHVGIPVPRALQKVGHVPDAFSNIEVQVRTRELHDRAEFGEWAHFKYKAKPTHSGESHLLEPRERWNGNWAAHFDTRIAFRDEAGVLREITRGATYADAAYSLLSDSDHPSTLRIENDELKETRAYDKTFDALMPLSRVRILARSSSVHAMPSQIGKLRTQQARTRVSARFLDESGTDANSAHLLADQGRGILNDERELMQAWSFSLDESEPATALALDVARALTTEAVHTVDALASHVASGAVDSRTLIDKWWLRFRNEEELRYKADIRRRVEAWSKAPISSTIVAAGRVRAIPYSRLDFPNAHLEPVIVPAVCCGPMPKDQIVGWNFEVPDTVRSLSMVSRASVIHRSDCPSPRPKILDLHGETWHDGSARRVYGYVEIRAYDRPRMLLQLANVISQFSPSSNIGEIIARPIYDSASALWLEVQLRDTDELHRLVVQLEKDLGRQIIRAARSLRPI